MPHNVACQHFLLQLSPFIDGELSPAQRVSVERHIQACRDCAARVADLRAESGLVRVGLEMAADEVDFSGFAQGVLARIAPDPLPIGEKVRLWFSELLLYQRPVVLSSLATAAALLLIGFPLLLREKVPAGYGAPTMVVQTVKTAPQAQVAPVVLESEQGNSIIWLVDKQSPDAQEELDQKPAEGGNL